MIEENLKSLIRGGKLSPVFEKPFKVCVRQMEYFTPAVIGMTDSGIVTGQYSMFPKGTITFMIAGDKKVNCVHVCQVQNFEAFMRNMRERSLELNDGKPLDKHKIMNIFLYTIKNFGSVPGKDGPSLAENINLNIIATLLSVSSDEDFKGSIKSAEGMLRDGIHPVYIGMLGVDINKTGSFLSLLFPMAHYLEGTVL